MHKEKYHLPTPKTTPQKCHKVRKIEEEGPENAGMVKDVRGSCWDEMLLSDRIAVTSDLLLRYIWEGVAFFTCQLSAFCDARVESLIWMCGQGQWFAREKVKTICFQYINVSR